MDEDIARRRLLKRTAAFPAVWGLPGASFPEVVRRRDTGVAAERGSAGEAVRRTPGAKRKWKSLPAFFGEVRRAL